MTGLRVAAVSLVHAAIQPQATAGSPFAWWLFSALILIALLALGGLLAMRAHRPVRVADDGQPPAGSQPPGLTLIQSPPAPAHAPFAPPRPPAPKGPHAPLPYDHQPAAAGQPRMTNGSVHAVLEPRGLVTVDAIIYPALWQGPGDGPPVGAAVRVCAQPGKHILLAFPADVPDRPASGIPPARIAAAGRPDAIEVAANEYPPDRRTGCPAPADGRHGSLTEGSNGHEH